MGRAGAKFKIQDRAPPLAEQSASHGHLGVDFADSRLEDGGFPPQIASGARPGRDRDSERSGLGHLLTLLVDPPSDLLVVEGSCFEGSSHLRIFEVHALDREEVL